MRAKASPFASRLRNCATTSIGTSLLEELGTRTVFAIVAGGMPVFAHYFASVALRFGPNAAPETLPVASPS